VKKDKDTSVDAAELRRRAEERLKEQETEDVYARAQQDAQRLVHELQVHQIELELQNEELRQSRAEVETYLEQYTYLYDFAPVGYFTLDQDGVILQVNLTGAKLLGVARSRLVNRRFGLYVSPDTRSVFSAFLESVCESRTIESCEVELLTEANGSSYMRIEAAVTRDGEECCIAMVDITERKQAEDALALANAQLHQNVKRLAELTETAERFVDTVSHEFRTPLAAIKEFTSILADGLGGPVTEDQAEYLGIMSNAVLDLAQMVDDLLDNSRLKAGTLRVNRRRCTGAEIMQSVRPMLLAKAKSKNIALVEDIAPDLSDVFADKEKAGRILINLAVNAIKFSPENSQVIIKAAEALDGGVEISVTDHGPGLSGDELEKIFDRFTQSAVWGEANANGFGLGLNIAKDFARLNLGEIHVESTPGKGSSFLFTLPRYDWREIVENYLRLLSPEAEGGLVVSGLELTLVEHDGSLDLVQGFLASACRPVDLILGDGEADRLILLGQTDTPADWAERLREIRVQSMQNDSLLRIPEIRIAVAGKWRCPGENDKITSRVLEEMFARKPVGQKSACS
jgi:PAS domain S-box-containing protein